MYQRDRRPGVLCHSLVGLPSLPPSLPPSPPFPRRAGQGCARELPGGHQRDAERPGEAPHGPRPDPHGQQHPHDLPLHRRHRGMAITRLLLLSSPPSSFPSHSAVSPYSSIAKTSVPPSVPPFHPAWLTHLSSQGGLETVGHHEAAHDG